MNYNINQKICQKCKICVEVCPCNIIEISNDKVFFISERKSICLRCGQCMAVCSTKAITIEGFSYGDDIIDLPPNNVNYKNFVDFLANRRSIRNFKDKAVSNEKINQILDTISYAPYGAKPEEMNVTVVNNRKKIEFALPYIESFLDNVVKWIENPITSYIIKKKNSPERFNTIKNHLYPISKFQNYKLKFGDRITRNAPAIIIFHANRDTEEHTHNSLIYATYVMLAAHSLKLGATMIGIIPAAINKVKEVREIFQIPKEDEAIMSVIIGYPKVKYKRAIKRKNENINFIV